MTEQYKPDVGELCKEDACRDAIHIAIAPVIAGAELRPGEHVGFIHGTNDVGREAVGFIKPIGVVDPFLQRNVMKGERFWLFLYPNTITNLRHVWSHPAFKPQLSQVAGN